MGCKQYAPTQRGAQTEMIRMLIFDCFSYDNDKSSLIAGSLYDVSLVVMPIIGGVVDYFGFRGLISSTAQFATIPIFFLFTFDNSIHPLPVFIWYGVTYSLTASVLWSCIPLVVDPAIVGTAMGLASFVQMLGIGCSNMVVGKFQVHKGSKRKLSVVIITNVKLMFQYFFINGGISRPAFLRSKLKTFFYES